MSCPATVAAATRGRTSSRRARPATTARAARRSTRPGSDCIGRRSSRAATSTRSSRRTSPISATRPGGRTCSWAGTEPVDMTRPEAHRPDSDAAANGTAAGGARVDDAIPAAVPETVRQLMAALWGAGHAVYVVGGSLRDTALGKPEKDWDLATDALPEETLAVFPDAAYENAFGT